MSKSIEVSDQLFERLQGLAGRLFSLEDVIERLLGEAAVQPVLTKNQSVASSRERSVDHAASVNVLQRRFPRQRGATVDVAGHRIEASTVPDLYEQVFKLLLNKGYAKKLDALVPFRTSTERYLISREAKHPNGKEFFVPVKVGNYVLEAHKNYQTALKQLALILAKLGLDLRYVP